ncbi:MAG: non-ribosomal peptide synthetase [Phycisphaeraceae bacterium]|nr:non-ribosomal peptide synthetase [Phycisphaeraceae bacterium]
MTPQQLLADLRRRDIKVWNDDGRLRFSAPAGRMTDDLRATLGAHKEAVLEFLRTAEATGGETLPPIEPADRPDALPLSFAQQRLWFLDQLDPGDPRYNMLRALRVRGPLDLESLGRALDGVVRRHEILRTRFTTRGDAPVQDILPSAKLEPVLVDLRGLPESDRWRRARTLAEREYQAPFDLAAAPLIRAKVCQLDEQDHVLLVAVHHIVADGWSLGVFLRELGALYESECTSSASPLRELALQYADYSQWQHRWFGSAVMQRQVNYWKGQLADPPVLSLATDRPRPKAQTYTGARTHFILPSELSAALRDLCRDQDATMFMTLLGGFFVLLHRYCGQNDIGVGAPIANRHHREIEDLIGFFVNTLVLRGDLEGDPTFRELLARVKRNVLDAYANQDLPFEKLVELHDPQRDLSHNPLFQVMFAFQNAPLDPLALTGLELEPFEAENTTAKFDLFLETEDDGACVRGNLEYNTDLFDEATARRIVTHFENLLRSATEDPDRPVSALTLMASDERRRVLEQWNRTGRDYPENAILHEMLEAQVARTPDDVAVVFRDETLTFDELNRRANRLAHELRERGIGGEVLVGICLARSIDVVISVLAVLKAGGGFVALDPTYPPQRLAFMLEDTKLPLLLTQTPLLESLPEFDGQILCMDRDAQSWSERPESNPDHVSSSQDAVYIIYTSGSTGRPKGIVMKHLGVANMVRWTMEHSAAGPGTRTAQFASLSFDISYQEMFATWCTGGVLVMIDQETRYDTDRLLSFLDHASIDRLFLPFVVFQQLADLSAVSGRVPDRLRELYVAGEQLRVTASIRRFMQGLEDCTLINQYGPSEAHVVTSWTLEGPPDSWPHLPPIGRPLANTKIVLLDDRLEPVPVGVPGEIFVGGRCLARGYLNRPELTAEKFIRDPFSDDPEDRLYRTGDQARFREDGRLEFLGRVDDQIKVRGFRVEPGEIEAVLCRQDRVREAAVIVHEDAVVGKRLIAYVVGDGAPPSADALRRFLADQVPDYMIPAVFVPLDELPLTIHGKLKRGALPPPPEGTRQLERPYQAPRTPLQSQLAEIWREVLGVERIGIEDNFFELGGHSILATRLVARMRRAFPSAELPLRLIFERPTIALLADRIDDEPTASVADAPSHGASASRNAPLSSAQQRLWYLHEVTPETAAYNLPAALRIDGALDVAALEDALDDVVAHHESLRTIFPTDRGHAYQVVNDVAPVTMRKTEIHDDANLGRALADEAARPFDLNAGPLIRALLVRTAPDRHVLLITMHHIVSDGWSLEILFEDLSTAYDVRTGSAGPSASCDEGRWTYADYVSAQDAWYRTPDCDRQVRFWRDRLAGAPTLELPTDRARPAITSFHGASATLDLDADLVARLERIGLGEQATLFMTLLTGFNILLQRHCRQEDIVIGTPVSGRGRAETERLIGFFVNMLVVRTDVDPELSFRQLLGRVRDAALSTFEHDQVPFEKLVDQLRPQRDPSRNPLFQVLFTLQQPTAAAFRPAGLDVTPVALGGQMARFDLEAYACRDDDRISVTFNYNRDLFDADTIDRMLAQFRVLLQSAATDPDQAVGALPLLTEAQRDRLVIAWNRTDTPYPRESSVVDLFEQQARQTPNAVALEFDGAETTYDELDRATSRMARRLQRDGVTAGSHVAICADRGAAFVVTMLAVLKAGAAYLPIDPTEPARRIERMLEQVSVSAIVTEPQYAGTFASADCPVTMLETVDDGTVSDEPLSPIAGPEDAAYVMFTSGSTGRPKGVRVGHRAIVRLVRDTNYITLSPRDGVAQASTVAFDAATFEVWGALLNGARLVGVPRQTLLAPSALADHVRERGIDVMFMTTPLFNQLADDVPEMFSRLRCLMFGGERADPDVVRRVARHHRPQHLLNVYGPTESTTFATWYEVPDDFDADSVPIGGPVANTKLYLLDDRMNPVPVGVTGQIWLGGDGVALGYAGGEASDHARFADDPFSSRPAARLYRTGDLARYDDEGRVHFVSRIDDQVKLRGFRIELGEIESVLTTHRALREVAVVMSQDRLLAYYVDDGSDPQPSELKAHLGAHLPRYMMPAHFVRLDRMPLTAGGKIDRKALPEPSRRGADAPGVPPESDTERRLAAIWRDILGIEAVGADDNFFDLGGHSLLSLKVTARIEKQIGARINPMDLMLQSLRQVAATCDREEAAESTRSRGGLMSTLRKMIGA